MNKQLNIEEIDREIRKLKKLCAQDKITIAKLRAEQQVLKAKKRTEEAQLKRTKIEVNRHIATIKKLRVLAKRKGVNLDNLGK